MCIRPLRRALFILLFVAAAFSQSAPKVAPLPYDPLELATGPTVVPDTPEKRAVLLNLLERARQNSAMHTPGMAPFTLKVSFNSTGGDSHNLKVMEKLRKPGSMARPGAGRPVWAIIRNSEFSTKAPPRTTSRAATYRCISRWFATRSSGRWSATSLLHSCAWPPPTGKVPKSPAF